MLLLLQPLKCFVTLMWTHVVLGHWQKWWHFVFCLFVFSLRWAVIVTTEVLLPADVVVFSLGGIMSQWLALLLHNKKVLGLNPSWGRAFLWGLCMFFLCSHGFSSMYAGYISIWHHSLRPAVAPRHTPDVSQNSRITAYLLPHAKAKTLHTLVLFRLFSFCLKAGRN